ncbi:MAG TPA: tyrosine--tRNA ligase [Candidatus Saccharimonadales bacterium]|nr:tyrosine--tRNA ligase [Candidatus Saccharimonadales bacterium]
MDVETKVAVIKSFAAEIVTEEELLSLLESKPHPVAYDGFEPSGVAGIHFGLMRSKNINKLLSTGARFKLYLADYFAYINNKLGGDLDRIHNAGKYFIEVWRAAGVDISKVEIIWNSELMKDFGYWERFLKIGKVTSLDRVKRAITIMGRKEGELLSSAQIIYPIMQATDIFQMDIDICQLGLDQRKANMLAREAAQKYGWKVPVVVSHPLLLGLKGAPPELKTKDEGVLMDYKMSKSDPKNSITVHDSLEEIKSKINSAYCPEKVCEGNPVFDYIEKIIIDNDDDPISVDRPQKFGGPLEFSSYRELTEAYKAGKVHPMDMKAFVAGELERRVRPIREHFEKNKEARELYETVKTYAITR